MELHLLVMTLMACSCTKQAPASAAEAPDGCSVVGSIPYWAQQDAFDSFLAHREHVDHLSLFWYHLDPSGVVRPYRRTREQADLVKQARARGIKVLGLVASLPDDEREGTGLTWDPHRVRKALHSQSRRTDHVAELLALARRMQFDGILIDYEALPPSQRSDFSAFIAELASALRADGRVLAVAIHPKTSEDDPQESNGSEAQDWDSLARDADQLHFMTYSQHTGTTPGPVASLDWVERVLRYAVDDRGLPRGKVFVGLPLYAEQWSQPQPGTYRGLDVDLTFRDVHDRRKRFDGSEHWSDEHRSPYLTYRDQQNTPHVVWFENERSSREKLALADSLGLCNFALWRLGGEDPGFWHALRDLRIKQAAGSPPKAKKKPAKKTKRAPKAKPAKKPKRGDTNAAADDEGDPAVDEPAPTNPAPNGGIEAAVPAAAQLPSEPTAQLEVTTGVEASGVKASGELATEVEYYNRFAFDEPEHERSNVLSSITFVQNIAFTDRLSLHQDVRVVLESDGEDRRYYSDFPHRGVYLRSLLLHYTRGPLAVFGGRYEPAEHLRSRKAIFFGNYSTNLELYGQLGGGAALRYETEHAGRHTLTGHLFRRDTSRLRGEILTDQARDYDYYGEVGEYGPPDSYLVTVDGEKPWRDVPYGYAVGGGMQTRGMYRDQHVLFGNLFGGMPLHGDRTLEVSVDGMYLRNARGAAEDRTILGAGIDYSHPRLHLGAAYSVRFVTYTEMPTPDADRTDHIFELVAGVPITRAWMAEAAYQRSHEWHATENALGIVFKYIVNWGVD